MSADRCQDLLDRSAHTGELDAARRPPPERPGGALERRLARAISDRLHDDGALVAWLQSLPPVQRLTARVVVIRQVGSPRGTTLCSRAFGPGQALFTAERAQGAGAPSRYESALSQGRREVLRALQRPGMPPDLAQGAPLLRMPLVQAAARRAATIYRRESGSGPEADRDHPALHEALARGAQGDPLPEQVRRIMEALLGARLERVRVHTDGVAAQAASAVRARAFTVGEDIFFAAGAFAPGSVAGLELLAHELMHVVQGYQGRVPEAGGAGVRVSQPQDALEREAEAVARSLAHGGAAAAVTQTDAGAPRLVGAADGQLLRAGDPHASVDTIPPGGAPRDKVGIVAWDGTPRLRLRSSPSTTEDNVITELAFNTHLQVIKEFPGKWYFVSTQDGQLGYAARDYIKTNLPEPNAKLHKVQPGLPGFAISIAEQYYKQSANDWGQDLRFYVNVLAWVNRREVPDTTSGWRAVAFQAGELIWIPTVEFARSLKGVVNSGSISHNIADAIGIADFLDRVGELWDDVRAAIALSKKYLAGAIQRHVEAALWGVLESIAMMLVMAVAVLAISTAIGAGLGALAGGVGAAPGAAAGFEIGMVLLEWLGLAMLMVWIGQSVLKVGGAFGDFLGGVWDARGDQRKLDLAARQFAEAIGALCGVILEGLVMWAVSIGATKALSALRGSRFGRSFNNTKTGEWLNERVRRVKAGETALPTPRDVLARLVRNTELVDAKNSPIGEFDGVDVGGQRFIENKSATGIDKPHPRTGQPQQTAADWAAKQVTKKTTRRIQALRDAVATRARPGTEGAVPTLGEIQGFRQLHFMIDGDAPALKVAVFAELAKLRASHPGWTFTVEFGVTVTLPPMPGTGQPDE